MSKSPSLQQDLDPMPLFEALKKIKRIRLLEGALGYCLVTLCLVCGFVYLDYALVARGLRFPGQSQSYMSMQFNGSLHKPTLDFLGEGGDGCDVFQGDWVWDDTYPLYHSKDCAFLDFGFRCSEHGRPDLFYTKWRWQPKECNLPRFDAKLMLEKLRNKRVVFAGDSIGRNQWESLLCLLSSAVENKSSIYEVHGSPITKHKGFLVFKFEQYNCTVEYYRSPFLVLQSRAPPGVPKNIGATLKLDQMDWNSVNWRDADVLIFNTGHWWNNEKTVRGGCYFQEGTTVNVKMKVEDAYRRSIETVLHWIHSEVNTSKTQVFFRTYAPVHFRGGNWRSGGNCHRETLPELGSSLVPSSSWEQFRIAGDVLSALSGSVKIDVLNITSMSSPRKDGHSSIYYLGKDAVSAAIRRQDCSHWCLPGVPDSWNELLYALFLKREDGTHKSNSSMYRAQA